ncbi:hypothetical protein Dimus_006076 [Dionaea muscipula]
MSYVINVPNHELPYGELLTRIFEAFNVPLNYKKGEDPKRRRDEDENAEVNNANAPAENVEVEVEASADMVVEVPEVSVPAPAFPASPADSTTSVQKEKTTTRVDPSGPSGSLLDSLLQHFQADLDRACTERLQAELDKAHVENTGLQALLQQATSHLKP